MGVEVKGAGDGVVIADRGCNDGCGCRDHSDRKSNVSLRTLQRTRRLPALIE